MKRLALAGSMLMSAAFGMGGCSTPNEGNAGTGTGGAKATGGSSGTGGSASGTGGAGPSGTGGSASGTGGSASGTGGSASGTGGAGPSGTGGSSGDAAPAETGSGSATMGFFVTSVGAGEGGNLGGLEGADAKCKSLAMAVSAELGAKNWKAYLSTATVNARDRIGKGPWRNSKNEIIANTLDQLHDQGETGMLNATWPIGAGGSAKALDEKGMPVSASPQRHDIITGTNAMGMVDGTNHCSNWTATTGMVTVGHSNRSGGGRPPSWTSAHTSGCAAVGTAGSNVGSGGGQGSIYCFAAD